MQQHAGTVQVADLKVIKPWHVLKLLSAHPLVCADAAPGEAGKAGQVAEVQQACPGP